MGWALVKDQGKGFLRGDQFYLLVNDIRGRTDLLCKL